MHATHHHHLPARPRTLLLALGACLAMGPLCAAAAGAPPSDAPLQATLLAEVTVTADVRDPDALRMDVADTPPLRVTLMPAVHVIAAAAPPAPAGLTLAGGPMPPLACCAVTYDPTAATLPPC